MFHREGSRWEPYWDQNIKTQIDYIYRLFEKLECQKKFQIKILYEEAKQDLFDYNKSSGWYPKNSEVGDQPTNNDKEVFRPDNSGEYLI